ncbi:DUF2130 domain-containing protein [Chryseolinea sp. T2]|uniref:DUF2130 domain-containing protein n=1 Tax=Chryseolinea sp. T2 TaxID=3129255 RepID=UPI0030778FDB
MHQTTETKNRIGASMSVHSNQQANKSTSQQIVCPHCGNKFSPEETLEHELRAKLEKEFQAKRYEELRAATERVRAEEGSKFQLHIRQIEEDRLAKARRLKSLEEKMVSVVERERGLQEREEGIELEMKKRLLERESVIREHVEKSASERAELDYREREQKLVRERELWEVQTKRMIIEESEKAREQERLRSVELQKKLEDQSRLINEMKKRSEQGSMQMQGEVQELAIEEYLQHTFPRDRVEEVAKGKRGGDCVHVVIDQFGGSCGRILYESKRTKHFSNDWIAKVKDDMRLQQAGVAVIVTEVLPERMTRFGEMEGVWICTFADFKALATLLRSSMIRIGEVVQAQENRECKMNLVYNYVTSTEFKQKLEAAFESYRDMQEDLIKEKALFTSQWAKREKRLMKAMENLAALYGDVRGMAGGAVQEISGLELPQMLEE